MVQVKCDCNDRYDIEINSYRHFEELKEFFEIQVRKGVFTDILVSKPYFIGYSKLKEKEIEWYATKWYKCNVCGCIWEFNYPDFPAKGFVRKLKV